MSLNKNFGKGMNLEDHEDTASLVHSGGSVYVEKKNKKKVGLGTLVVRDLRVTVFYEISTQTFIAFSLFSFIFVGLLNLL